MIYPLLLLDVFCAMVNNGQNAKMGDVRWSAYTRQKTNVAPGNPFTIRKVRAGDIARNGTIWGGLVSVSSGSITFYNHN